MTKFNLTVAVNVRDSKGVEERVQMTFNTTSKELEDFNDTRELAIFRTCECINREMKGKRPIFRTMDFWLRPLSDQAWS